MIRSEDKRMGQLVLTLLIVLVFAIVSVTAEAYGVSKLSTPRIKTLKSTSAGTFIVTAKKNSKATGFQINYSLNKSGKQGKVKTVKTKGKALKKKISGLKEGKVYFVRIRTYKKVSGVKTYSAWSEYKTVRVLRSIGGKTVYTTELYTSVYPKPDSSSKAIGVFYNTKMKLISTKKNSKGSWNKVNYRGQTKYVWIGKNQKKFTTTSGVLKSYNKFCTTSLQKEVLACAFKYNNVNTAYAFTKGKYIPGKKYNGKYYFDCSGYATYVINTVMQKKVPSYNASSDMKRLAEPEVLAYEGKYGKIKSSVVCRDNINFKKLKVGDILLFKVMEDDPRSIDHAAIYIGNKQIIQSTRAIKDRYLDSGLDKDGGVCVAPLKGEYKTGFKRAVRVLP